MAVILEDYFQVASLKSVVRTGQWHRFETRVERNTLDALELLDEFGIKATFFVLGWIADEVPEVVREVARRGHEVASKGYYHRSLQQLDESEFRSDLARSREALETASGQRVRGYRIAHSWLGPQDLWALDVLADEGFLYDSSIRPLFRGFSDEPWRRFPHLHRGETGTIWEIPISAVRLAGWSIPISGGNYLRQLPQWFVRRAIDHWDRGHEAPLAFYFHVWELDPDQPRINAAPLHERVRQYRNLDRMERFVRYYLSRYRFQGFGEYLRLDREEVSPAPEPRTAAPAIPLPEQSPSDPVSAPTSATTDRTPVSVVIPCYNEELILPYLANTLRSVTAVLNQYDLGFIFVDDGSLDGTAATLDSLFGGRSDCAILHHDQNQGVAAAIQTGLSHARTEVVCSIDCDCTYDPHQLQVMIPMLRDNMDIVTASPYHPAGQVRNVPWWRLFLSRRLSQLYRLVLRHKIATYTSCFRVYRRSAVVTLPVREGGFLGVAEVLGLLDLQGGQIAECPAVLEARLFGQSKMKVLSTIFGHLRLLVRLASSKARQAQRLR
ncbi:MAG: DUF3473 domain-containing protein [bacterium]|nr:DUF3473 domain-containing protein [bacterium]